MKFKDLPMGAKFNWLETVAFKASVLQAREEGPGGTLFFSMDPEADVELISSPTPVVKDTNPKDAIGCKKPPLSTLPAPVLFEVGLAMLEGAMKYRRHNYRLAGVRASIYYDAALRHLMSWWEGQDTDPDSGLPHLVKAIACLVILRDGFRQGNVNDDRPPAVHQEWMEDLKKRADDLISRFPNPLPPYTNGDLTQ